jgi:Derlin-2/3
LLRNQQAIPFVLSLRGGSDSDDESDYDLEDGDDEDLFGVEEGDGGSLESDFANENVVDRMLSAWERTPPFTKAYMTACFSAAVLGFIFNNNQLPDILSLDWKKTFASLQLWRPLTSFFNIGPFGILWFLQAHFVWTYMSTLERLNHKRPYDFWIMILFGQISMVIGYPLLKLNPQSLGHNLSTFFVYVWARYHEGIQVSIFDMFTARAEFLPWFFLAQTYLLEGQPPILDFLGIVFGHIYYHLKTVGVLRAPDSLVKWYQSDNSLAVRIRQLYKPISKEFEIVA